MAFKSMAEINQERRQKALDKLARGEKIGFSERALVKDQTPKTPKAVLNVTKPAPVGTIMVRRYKGDKAVETASKELIQDGWHIQGMTTRKAMYSALTGVFTRKQIHTVTWTKD